MIKAQINVTSEDNLEKYEALGLSINNIQYDKADVYINSKKIDFFYSITDENDKSIQACINGYVLPIVYDEKVEDQLIKALSNNE